MHPLSSLGHELSRLALSCASPSFQDFPSEALVPVPVAAQLLGYRPITLQTYRTKGVLPAASGRYCRPILYRVADLREYIARRGS